MILKILNSRVVCPLSLIGIVIPFLLGVGHSAEAVTATSESPYEVDWISHFGSAQDEFIGGVAVDHLGSIIVTGFTEGSMEGPSAGGRDAYLVKYDTLGSLTWSRQIGSEGDDVSYSVAVDSIGNAFITGATTGLLSDAPKVRVYDPFVTKFDPSGSTLWIDQTASGEIAHVNSAIVTDRLGRAYTFGQIIGDSLDPLDIIRRFNPTGEIEYSRFSRLLPNYASNLELQFMELDSDGNLIVALSEFNTKIVSGVTSSLRPLLAKFNSEGFLMWVETYDSFGNNSFVQSVAVDNEGNSYLAGIKDLGSASPVGYLLKYNSNGQVVMELDLDAQANEMSLARSVEVDSEGFIYLVGSTLGDPDLGNLGQNDALLVKYDPLGELVWSKQFGGPEDEVAMKIAIGSTGDVYVVGLSNTGTAGESLSQDNVFVAKLVVPEPSTSAMFLVLALMVVRRRR